MADLVERLDLGGAGAALGHDERPDRLHVAVAGLACTLGSPRQRRPSRFHGISWIRLAGAAARLAVGPVDLDHLDACGAQEPRQARAIRTSAFDPHAGDRAERAQPAQELVVAHGRRLEVLDGEQPADVIEGGGDVDIQVGIDAARDRARAFYDGHRHPFLLLVVKGWHSPLTWAAAV